MTNSLKCNLKTLARLALTTCCLTINTMSFAADEGAFGLTEENANMARKTLADVRKNLDEAVRRVERVIYPNLGAYGVKTNTAVTSAGIVANLIGGTTTSGVSSSLKTNDISSSYTNYKNNPYISRLAIIDSGLRVQMQFISSTGSITSGTTATSSQVPIFEPFYSKRIVLIPIFNAKYDATTGSLLAKDQEITSWECLTDADEYIGSTGTGTSEGMRSVVSIGGGVLGTCQYISTTSMDSVWGTI